jgi:proline dehydrogenase
MVLRRAAMLVAHQPRLRKLALSTPGVRGLAWRFVAGEDLDAGVVVVRALNERGMQASLNLVGTHVGSRSEAAEATAGIVESLARIAREGLACHVSIKLTQIGLDIDEAFARAQLVTVLDRAREAGVFVRIDMEESRYVEDTLLLFDDVRARYGDEGVGVVVQSYLRGREGDLERLLDTRARVRLVKGGYWEAPDVVWRDKVDIDAAFGRDIERLMRRGSDPAIATHDPAAVDQVCALADRLGMSRDAFEFQMLLGVRPDLQASLVRDGYRVRCYVPYGGQWHAYVLGCLRRLPEGAVRHVRERASRRPLVRPVPPKA